MKQFFWISVLIICASCTNEEQKGTAAGNTVHNNVTDTIVTNAAPVAIAGCYEMINGRDTATLQVSVKDTTVTGNLVFDWAEKDGNKGTLQGVLRDSLIIADYTFESEGLISVRQEVFKIEEGAMVHGYGAVKEKSGKIVYQNPDDLQYDTLHIFKKRDCP